MKNKFPYIVLAFVLLTFTVIYLLTSNTKRWPWTTSVKLDSWESITVGETRVQIFEKLASLKKLQLIGNPRYITEAGTFLPISEDSSKLDTAHTMWQLNLVDGNRWLLLHFDSQKLNEIEKYHYRGPNDL